MSGGSLFQSRGAATLNARSPSLSLVRGTTRSPFEVDRSWVGLSRSDTGCSMSVMYVGAADTEHARHSTDWLNLWPSISWSVVKWQINSYFVLKPPTLEATISTTALHFHALHFQRCYHAGACSSPHCVCSVFPVDSRSTSVNLVDQRNDRITCRSSITRNDDTCTRH